MPWEPPPIASQELKIWGRRATLFGQNDRGSNWWSGRTRRRLKGWRPWSALSNKWLSRALIDHRQEFDSFWPLHWSLTISDNLVMQFIDFKFCSFNCSWWPCTSLIKRPWYEHHMYIPPFLPLLNPLHSRFAMRTPHSYDPCRGPPHLFSLGRSEKIREIKARNQLLLTAHRVHNARPKPSASSLLVGTECKEPESKPDSNHYPSSANLRSFMFYLL